MQTRCGRCASGDQGCGKYKGTVVAIFIKLWIESGVNLKRPDEKELAGSATAASEAIAMSVRRDEQLTLHEKFNASTREYLESL